MTLRPADMAGPVAGIAPDCIISGKALDKPSKVHATPGPNLLIRRFCADGTGNPFLPVESQPGPDARTSQGERTSSTADWRRNRSVPQRSVRAPWGVIASSPLLPAQARMPARQSGHARPEARRVMPAAVMARTETGTTET